MPNRLDWPNRLKPIMVRNASRETCFEHELVDYGRGAKQAGC